LGKRLEALRIPRVLLCQLTKFVVAGQELVLWSHPADLLAICTALNYHTWWIASIQNFIETEVFRAERDCTKADATYGK
jgi:hypothetical protein